MHCTVYPYLLLQKNRLDRLASKDASAFHASVRVYLHVSFSRWRVKRRRSWCYQRSKQRARGTQRRPLGPRAAAVPGGRALSLCLDSAIARNVVLVSSCWLPARYLSRLDGPLKTADQTREACLSEARVRQSERHCARRVYLELFPLSVGMVAVQRGGDVVRFRRCVGQGDDGERETYTRREHKQSSADTYDRRDGDGCPAESNKMKR